MASDNDSSEDSQENSATEISTDSEFEHDGTTPTQHEIPEITINDGHVRKSRGQYVEPKKVQVKSRVISSVNGNLKQTKEPGVKLQFSKLDPTKEVVETAASPREKVIENPRPNNTNALSPSPLVNPRKGDYLLNRTHSTEGIASKLSLELKKRYLLGSSGLGGSVMKSGSTSNVDTRLRNLSDAISQHQKLLNPAPEPSPTMQAFLQGTNKLRSTTNPISPISPTGIFTASPLKTFTVQQSSAKSQISKDSNPQRDVSKVQLPDLVKETNILKSKTEPNILRVDAAKTIPLEKPVEKENSEKIEANAVDKVSSNSTPAVDEDDVCRPRSPLHETSIVVPQVDWNKNVDEEVRSKDSSDDTEIDSDSLSSSETEDSDGAAKKELSVNLSPPRLQIHSTDGDLLLDEDADKEPDTGATFEPDSIEFIDTREELVNPVSEDIRSVGSASRVPADVEIVNHNLKKLELNDTVTAKSFSNCSSPTSSTSNKHDDSMENDVTTAALTETEFSEWARDGEAMVADDLRDVEFDINPEFITTRRNRGNREKNVASSAAARMAKEEDLTDIEVESFRHDRAVGAPSNDTSKLLANGEDIDYMDTDNESLLDDSLRDATNMPLLKNRGYVEFVNVGSPPKGRPEMRPIVDAPIARAEVENEFCSDDERYDENIIEINPVTMEDIQDRLNDAAKKSIVDSKPLITLDFSETNNDEPAVNEAINREMFQSMDEDSLLVIEPAEDTTTSELITILASPVNPQTTLLPAQPAPVQPAPAQAPVERIEESTRSINDVNNPDYLEYVKRLQSRIAEFSNAKDSIDIRKSKRKNSKGSSAQNRSAEMIAEEIKSQEENAVQANDASNSPATSRKLEEITRERTKQKTLIQDLLMDKMEAHKQKSAEKKARRAARTSSFTSATTLFSNVPSPVPPSPTPSNFVPSSIVSPMNSPVRTTFAEAKKTLQDTPTSTHSYSSNAPSLLSTFRSQSRERDDTSTSRPPSRPESTSTHEDAFKAPVAPPRLKHEEARRTAEKAKQQARERARLKSDEDLGLSPEDKIRELRMKVARRQLSMEDRRRTEDEVTPDVKTRHYSFSFSRSSNKLQSSKSTDNVKALAKKMSFEPLPAGNAKSMDELLRAGESAKVDNEAAVVKRDKKKAPKDPERRKSIIKAVSDFFKKKETTPSPPSQKDKVSMFRLSSKSKDKGKVIRLKKCISKN